MSIIPSITKRYMNRLPKTAGVYLFYQKKLKSNTKHPTPIYIGKAINVKDRVKNHFQQPSYRDNLFIGKVSRIGFIETGSEIQALILEADLIKKYQPKFNVVWRDDKNYFYVALAKSKEKVPYIYITHQPSKFRIQFIGPFVEGNSLKKTLKFLRRVFPYYISPTHPKQKCTWCHLDLCPGPDLNLQEYKKSIKKLVLILQGKRKNVLNILKREMKIFSQAQEYESAKKVRDKMYAFEQVMAHTHVIENQNTKYKIQNSATDKWEEIEKILKSILNINNSIKRMECYDISNIQGKNATGSMVVFTNGVPDKSQYKKFRVRMKNEPNDIAMLKEIITRRLLHPEWSYPEVMLIDGGIAQLNIAIKAKKECPLKPTAVRNRGQINKIKIISIAKGRQELFIENPPSHKALEGQRNQPIPLKNLPQDVYNLIKHLDDEAHRFAISYHKKLRKQTMGLKAK